LIARTPLRALWLTALTVCAARQAAAQDVFGHTPENSPYRYVESPRELSLFGGYLIAGKDPAGVAPQSATLVGIREMLHLGGPVMFYTRLAHSFSQRTVVDPAAPISARFLGTRDDALTIFDLDLGIDLTGDRSWHNIMPYFGAGPAVVSDMGAPRDKGKYHFGTTFAATYGGGFRWVPPGRLSIHADVNAYEWLHHYPATYHTNAFGTPVLPTTHKLAAWRDNGTFTLGASFAIWR